MKRLPFIMLILLASSCFANTVSDALQELRPGAEWTLEGNSYEGLQWGDQSQSKPTKQEVEILVEKYEVARKRKAEYPSIDDRVNALLDGGQSLVDIKKKIDDVNKKYPVLSAEVGESK